MDRRSLLKEDENAMSEARGTVNVFDDEFEVEDFDVVADGMRNSDHDRERGNGRGSPQQEDEPVRSTAAHYAPISGVETAGNVARGSVRWSMRKSGSAAVENPFASPQDHDGPQQRMPRLSFEPDIARRSISSASSRHFPRPANPGISAGPSHPYALYPQGTTLRTLSGASSSTARPAQRYAASHNGPQHPYTMYPQGVSEEVDDEDEDEDGQLQSSVPVGFPGRGHAYRRQRGPDGEEQDLIGEDGHTELLPPYTRYPEDGPEKMPLLVPVAPTALHSRAPVAGTDPGMPLMHTALRPQQDGVPASMSDESTLLRQASRVGSMPLQQESSAHKSWSEKSWKEKKKTRFCGIPLGWILLAICVLAFITAVLGGLVSHFLEHHHDYHWDDTTPMTSLYDASPLSATPTVSPPTGIFALALSTPQQTQAQCLTHTSQQVAWSCDLAGEPAITINVQPMPGTTHLGASICYGSNETQIYYGTQSPNMQTQLSPFMAVVDNDAPGNGPAFYFQQFYDKIVVVPEAAISAGSSKLKERAAYTDLLQGSVSQTQATKAGEKPWFCIWNNTFVEGFIYVQQPVAQPTLNTTSSATTTPTASAPANSTSPSWSMPGPPGPQPTAPPSQPGPPFDRFTTTYTDSSTTMVFDGQVAQYSAWSSWIDDNSGTSPHTKQKRQQADSDGDFYSSLQTYPFMVKLEERRLPGNTVQPYCQQMQILDDGTAGLALGTNGQPAKAVVLTELDPDYAAYQSAGLAGSRKRDGRLVQRRGVSGSCHCQWMSGQP